MNTCFYESVFAIGAPGIPELIIILVIVLVIFGGSKLPMVGENLGKGIRSFKKALTKGADDNEVEDAGELDVTPAEKKALPSENEAAVQDVEVEEVSTP
jgi:sec-independent protein translocase protein TatA